MLDKAQLVNSFKLCDEISGDTINVRKDMRIAESQLTLAIKKQEKLEWYTIKSIRDLPGGKRILVINMMAQHITFNKAIKA